VTVGQRIRVLGSNGREGILGFEGTITMLSPSGYVVVLDNDPAREFHTTMIGGLARVPPHHIIQRFFYPFQVELID